MHMCRLHQIGDRVSDSFSPGTILQEEIFVHKSYIVLGIRSVLESLLSQCARVRAIRKSNPEAFSALRQQNPTDPS